MYTTLLLLLSVVVVDGFQWMGAPLKVAPQASSRRRWEEVDTRNYGRGEHRATLFMSSQGRNRRGPPQKQAGPPMNEGIQAEKMRVMLAGVNAKDEPLGILSREEALQKAAELDLDLVLIAEQADPPVAKIIDYGKFKYASEKKKKEQKRNAKAAELKEVKCSYKIELHDYEVRLKNARRFLEQGHRVRFVVSFRGREMQHIRLGQELLEKFKEDTDEVAQSDPVRREGPRLIMITSPKSA